MSHNRPVSVVGKFHLICFQLGQQQHQDLDEYEENDLQHTPKADLKEDLNLTLSRKKLHENVHLRKLLSPRN